MNIDLSSETEKAKMEFYKDLIEAYKVAINGAKKHNEFLDEIIKTQRETINALKERKKGKIKWTKNVT